VPWKVTRWCGGNTETHAVRRGFRQGCVAVSKRVECALVLNGHLFKNQVGQSGCPHRINFQGSGKQRRRGQQLSGGLQTRARLGRVLVRRRKPRM